MSSPLSLAEIRKIIGANPLELPKSSEREIAVGITTDTRELKPQEVFLALPGTSFDGHNFLKQAVEKGAIALIISQEPQVYSRTNIPQLQVPDTLKAYQQIGRWWREQFSIPIIGVTGSVGKTTTKELIAAVLATQGSVHKTEANFNNEIGVPKTLLKLTPDHDYGIIEMAMRGSGEIAELTEIARPTIAVITNVGTAHIGRLGSENAIAIAKCEILAQMDNNGVAILNHDNSRLINTAKDFWQGETLTYGLEGGDIQGKIIDPQTIEVEQMQFQLPLPGRHNALNYLSALAVAKVLNIPWKSLTQGVSVQLPKGRSQSYQLPNNITVLDETYNAGVESMIAALQLLKETPGKRHIAVLGTMKELGTHGKQLHQQVGETVKALGLDQLLVLVDDPEAQGIADAATGVTTQCFTTHADLLQSLEEIIQPGDSLLFKASNSVGLTQVVQKFCDQRR